MTHTKHFFQITNILMASAVILASPPTDLSAANLSCDDVKVIFARGSNEPLNGPNFQEFLSNLKPTIKQHAPKLKVSYHELDYPAGGLSNFTEVITTAVTAGEAAAFNDSIAVGQKSLKNFIANALTTCPATKFVLAGYSQGAMVISKSLPNLNSSQIIYAATFGDPKLHLPEGFGPDPAACHGRNLSNYRQTVPDCHTATGILTALKNYQPTGYKDKLGAWCNAGDFMCGSYFDFLGGLMKAHTSYNSNGAYQEAAGVIISAIKKFFPSIVSNAIKPNYSKRDVAILIDGTSSMKSFIKDYAAEALRLARKNIEQGGRVALFTYGDLMDTKPKQLCGFTTDLATFQTALESIKLGGGIDFPESALSGLLHTMNTLKWQKGADKSIILLTDASYHSPDLDGTTLPQVVQRSLEIDPVNIFIITEGNVAADYQSLAAATNGAVSVTGSFASVTEHITKRPIMVLNHEFYSAAIGDTVNFSVNTIASASQYQWDLDGDGRFELTTTTPSASRVYQENLTGYIQARAMTNSGYYVSASAPIRIFDSRSPNINSLTGKVLGTDARITFKSNAKSTLVIIDNTPAGLINQTTFTLTELKRPTKITLVPIAASGQRGEVVSTTVSPAGFSPIVPRTGVR